MKFAIGSKNPTKVNAVKNVVQKLWDNSQVESTSSESGVSDQPTTYEEALKGAINRANSARDSCSADIGIGMEGYTFENDHGMFVSNICVAINDKNELGVASGGSFQLPNSVAEKIRNGGELGPSLNELFSLNNVKHNEGASGIFTSGYVNRTVAQENAVAYALAKFITPHLYKER